MLTATVTLADGTYQAAVGSNATDVEWPPAPGRLFQALVAAAGPDHDRRGPLAELERLDPPQVVVPPAGPPVAHGTYVPTNAMARTKDHQDWPQRTAGRRDRASVMPTRPRFHLVWPDGDPDLADGLDALAADVGYLGRSTCQVQITFTTGRPDVDHAWTTYTPEATGTVDLAVPYPGYLAALDDAFDLGQPSRTCTRYAAYTPAGNGGRRPDLDPHVLWGGTFVWRLRGLVDAVSFLAVADGLRAAVMSQADTVASTYGLDLPDAVTGHGQGRSAAWLALPDVGHRHATGHVLGVAVALPTGLSDIDRKLLVRAMAAVEKISVPGHGHLGVDRVVGTPATAGLRPARWVGPAQTWTTVTPLVLDRHPHDGDLVATVAQSCRFAGLPDPAQVSVHRDSRVPGAPTPQARQLTRNGRPPGARVHATVTFDRPVAGPVTLGRLRTFAGGLSVPVRGGGQ